VFGDGFRWEGREGQKERRRVERRKERDGNFHRHKESKDVDVGQDSGFNMRTITLEVGSRGFLNLQVFKCYSPFAT